MAGLQSKFEGKVMNLAILAYSSAMGCVISRGFLNVIDRSIFKRDESKFYQIIFLNALLPLIVSLLITYALYPKNEVLQNLSNIAIIFNALGAQAAATAFSNGFKNMSVRNVCASTKIADLLIPILTFVISRNFSIPDYLFSSISVLIFAPIFIGMNKKDNVFCIKSTLLILGILLLQAAINVLFKTNALTNTSMKFYSFMCGILFWRVLFVLPIFLINNVRAKNIISTPTISKLFLRAILAFFSQSLFFYSITRISSASAWPVINSGPLVSCVIAHFIVNEKMKRPEYITMILFLFLSLGYSIYMWRII